MQVKFSILDNYPPEISPVFFLFAATNFRLKGLKQLMAAIHLAASKNPAVPIHLFVAGNDYSQTYLKFARELEIEDKISFLGSVAHIQNALVLSDVAVLPTFYDPASRFILEALAMSKPVITTAYNGSSDLFTNNRHGIVIDDPRNIDALADALLHFCNRDNLTSAVDAINSDDIKSRVSIDRHISQLLQLYENIMSRKGVTANA
jgi:glycosyltransferase involved in cell wall biosynthesis